MAGSLLRLNAAVLLMAVAAACAEQHRVEVPERWQFRLDPGGVGLRERWHFEEWPEDTPMIRIGQWWEPQGHAYDGYAWYRTEIHLPEELRARPVAVRFGAVDEDAWVYWNGRLAGHHRGWQSAFEVEVTQWVDFGMPNSLVVRVLDTLMMGGIYKPVSVVSPTRGEEPDFVKRLRTEGVRIAHLSGRGGTVPPMAEAGCNVMMHNTWALQKVAKSTPADAEQIVRADDLAGLQGRVTAAASECRKVGAVSLCSFYGLSGNEAQFLNQHRYRKFVDAVGTEGTVSPCPLSRRYWFGLLLPQFRLQAQALKEASLPGGVIVDLEFYAGGDIYPWWGSRDLCYCDSCWELFCTGTGQPETSYQLTAEERGTWINRQELSDDYHGVLGQHLAMMMRDVADECRGIHPNFLMGFYFYTPHWISDAILRGWSTPELPALAMSEAEYYSGFNRHSEEKIVHLRERGINALYIGGVMQGRCMPRLYAAMADELARRADGYWLYYAAMFFEPGAIKNLKQPEKGNEYSLAAPPEEYLNGLRQGNDGLDEGRSVVADFPKQIDLTAQLREVESAHVPARRPVAVANAGFEKAFTRDTGWASAYPLPRRDKRNPRAGRYSARFDPPEGHGKGLVNLTQPVKFEGDTDYIIQLWARTSGPVDGQGMGLLLLPSGQAATYGHYAKLPGSKWTRLSMRLRTKPDSTEGVLNIHAASPRATIWIDDVEVLPVRSVAWETDPIELPGGTPLGRLLWETDLDESDLRVSVHDASNDERLQYGSVSGMFLSRLDNWPHREFVFRVRYEGAGEPPAAPVAKLWLEAGEQQ